MQQATFSRTTDNIYRVQWIGDPKAIGVLIWIVINFGIDLRWACLISISVFMYIQVKLANLWSYLTNAVFSILKKQINFHIYVGSNSTLFKQSSSSVAMDPPNMLHSIALLTESRVTIFAFERLHFQMNSLYVSAQVSLEVFLAVGTFPLVCAIYWYSSFQENWNIQLIVGTDDMNKNHAMIIILKKAETGWLESSGHYWTENVSFQFHCIGLEFYCVGDETTMTGSSKNLVFLKFWLSSPFYFGSS